MVFDEFGIDIHSIPSQLQSSLNQLVTELIKERLKKSPK